MERTGAFFKQDNRINILDVTVIKFFPVSPNSLILAQQKVRRITSAALARKHIPNPLHFHIRQASVRKLHHNVHGQKRTFICKPCGIRGNHFNYFYFLIQHARKEIAKPLRNVFRVHDLLEKTVIQELKPLHAGTDV